MRVFLRLSAITLLLLGANSFVSAQEIGRVPNAVALLSERNNGDDDKNKKSEKKDAPKTGETVEIKDPLVNLLVKKGLLSETEASSVSGGSPVEQRDRLANLLFQKGLITVAELDAMRVISPPAPIVNTAMKTDALPPKENIPNVNSVAAAPQATPPAVIPAIAPLRVLQLEGAKRDGLIPDIKLGTGVKLKLYGFFKTSVVYDSSNPPGNDFPLPGFLNDSGPNGSPEFRIKARSFRLGANFEWLDISPKLSLTGRLEFDFEGDFTRATNRNISSIRSSQPSIRLAWVRLDRTFGEKTAAHVLVGQDWTPFGSSTVPNTIETTGFHLAYGNIYERAPQIRTGLNFLLSKNRNVRLLPEIAFVLPFFGNTPANVADQLGFGERQGVDSGQPEYQGRIVLQFQLDKAAGVAPAQLITSWTYGRRKAIVARGNVPTAFLNDFGGGAEVESERYGYTGEFQLPTRWFTLIGKYYRGADLRAYFGGQLYSTYNDTFGLNGVVTGTSLDGSATVAFGCRVAYVTVCPTGQSVIANQEPIRGQGGFINLGIPLSRIFGVDPKSRMAGFTAYLHYGYDEASASDVRRLLGNTLGPTGLPATGFGANRGKSDVAFASLHYRLNAFVTFAFEQSYFRTRAANNGAPLPLFRGVPTRETHNNRSELATIFTF